MTHVLHKSPVCVSERVFLQTARSSAADVNADLKMAEMQPRAQTKTGNRLLCL